MASSSPRPWVWGHRGHPQHPTMERCVVGCCSAPHLRSPIFPTRNAPVLPWVLIPPGPSTSPYPVVVPKYDVTAERPVDVQVHLHDVPGGDQGLLLRFLWEIRVEELASGTQTPTCHQVLSWAGSPGASMVVCPSKTSFLPLGGWGRQEGPLCLWNCVRAWAEPLWAGR